MLDKFLALLERFVVAHELIAANSAKQPDITVGPLSAETIAELERTSGKSTGGLLKAGDEPKTVKAKPRQTKPKTSDEPDIDKLRAEIVLMAQHIGSGDSDDCNDELDDLLDDYDARSVQKLKDSQLPDFHKELKAIVAKYYDIEDDN